MSSRASKLALIASFAVVLGLGIVILQLVHSSSASESPPAPRPAAPAAPATPAPSIVSPAPRGSPPVPLAGHRIAPTPAPGLAPAPAPARREFPRDDNGNIVPVINVRLLREQQARTDAPMTACLAREPAHPTGKATLVFAVAAKDGKLLIESTGVQDAGTLAAYPGLLDCMQQTAGALAPILDQYTPTSPGTTIYVRRHVRVDDGALAENAISDFSYFP